MRACGRSRARRRWRWNRGGSTSRRSRSTDSTTCGSTRGVHQRLRSRPPTRRDSSCCRSSACSAGTSRGMRNCAPTASPNRSGSSTPTATIRRSQCSRLATSAGAGGRSAQRSYARCVRTIRDRSTPSRRTATGTPRSCVRRTTSGRRLGAATVQRATRADRTRTAMRRLARCSCRAAERCATSRPPCAIRRSPSSDTRPASSRRTPTIQRFRNTPAS